MRPAQPFGSERGDPSPLRLVGGTSVSARELLEQANTAELRGRQDIARDLYERALDRAIGSGDANTVPIALLNSARLANAAGDVGVALDILEAAVASATASGLDGDCARAASLRARVLWESGEVISAEGDAARARDWARKAGDAREAAAAVRTLGELAVARGALGDGVALYEDCLA